MGISAWDPGHGLSIPQPARNPRPTIRCEYGDTGLAPTTVSFTPSRSYGLSTASETHDWFLCMIRSYEEFVVETDKPGEAPMPFYSETVRRVVVE